MKAWHFVRENRRLGYGDDRIVKVGKTYNCKGELVLCVNGLHGSKRIIDALRYSPGPILCRVKLSGEIIHDLDKSVARKRTVITMNNISDILHEFACRCAEDALALSDSPDPRSIAAIKAKRDWLKGKITDKELAAARDTAWAARTAVWAAKAAAGDVAGAAWDVAWDAGAAKAAAGDAWDAAVWAVWAAAGDAARDAAGAAWDAAGAAWDAKAAWDTRDAGDAAWDVWDAWDAARDAQIDKLLTYFKL